MKKENVAKTIESRPCIRCEEPKPISEFYRNSASKDGLSRRCKSCVKVAKKAYNESPQGKAAKKAYHESPKVRGARKAYEKSPKGKAAKKAYQNTPKSKTARKRYNESPEGKAARQSPEGKARRRRSRAVAGAIRAGRLKRGPCAYKSPACSVGIIHGHHWSYAEEHLLDVVWLCRKHHDAEHNRGSLSWSRAVTCERILTVEYSVEQHGWRVLDPWVERLARGRRLGVEAIPDTAHRRILFEYATEQEAKNALQQLRKAFRGYRPRVCLSSNAAHELEKLKAES